MGGSYTGRTHSPFFKPKDSEPTAHLLVGNIPGLPLEELTAVLSPFGLTSLTAPSAVASHVFASFSGAAEAAAARRALHGQPCPMLGGRTLVIQHAGLRRQKLSPEDLLRQLVPAQLSAAACGVAGLLLLPDFVCEAEEARLLALVDPGPWIALAHRRVQHFGAGFDYTTRQLDGSTACPPIPGELAGLVRRVEALPGSVPIDQLTVNEYPAGVGISPHCDAHSAFTGAVALLSLASPAVLALRREGAETRALFLPRRSLLLLSGEARYGWEHYIPHRKSDPLVTGEVVQREPRRVSLTLRQVRGHPCDCPYPLYCDSQQGSSASCGSAVGHPGAPAPAQQQDGGTGCGSMCTERQSPPKAAASQQTDVEHGRGSDASSTAPGSRTRDAAGAAARPVEPSSPGMCCSAAEAAREQRLQRLEDEHVNAVYNAIAPHFSATRFAVWPKVREFVDALAPGSLVADVGCGNGKYLGLRKDVFMLGSDRSTGLVAVASRRLQPDPKLERVSADVAVADALALPLRPASCDAVLCIAVVHHLSSVERRLRLLAQLLRTLRLGGRALVTVWATEQGNMKKVRQWQRVGDLRSAAADELGDAVEAVEDQSGSGGAARQQQQQHDVRGSRGGGVEQPGGRAGEQQMGAQEQAGACEGPVESGDYFVPWHLPFHRAEAAAAAAKTRRGGGRSPAAGCGDSGGGSDGPAVGPCVDTGKGAVVFRRYYHLFGPGEIEALVAHLPGAALVSSCYDKDNWCVVFERVA